VAFAHLGRAEARALLAATPALLLVQMLLLPVFLLLLLGEDAAGVVRPGPFARAFLWLIAAPLALAALVQRWTGRSRTGARASAALEWLPVPATALVLFVVVAAVVARLAPALDVVLRVIPFYLAFAVLAPLLGWAPARRLRLDVRAARSVAFSAATRNSLVVPPLAFAVPGAVPVLPAVVVESIEAAIFYPPAGWFAAALAPADRWLGRRFLAGGAFLVMVATKPAD